MITIQYDHQYPMPEHIRHLVEPLIKRFKWMLPPWVHVLSIRYVACEPLSTALDLSYLRLTLRLGNNFGQLSESEMKRGIIHEFMHAYTSLQYMEFLDLMDEHSELSEGTCKTLTRVMEQKMEMATEGLTSLVLRLVDGQGDFMEEMGSKAAEAIKRAARDGSAGPCWGGLDNLEEYKPTQPIPLAQFPQQQGPRPHAVGRDHIRGPGQHGLPATPLAHALGLPQAMGQNKAQAEGMPPTQMIGAMGSEPFNELVRKAEEEIRSLSFPNPLESLFSKTDCITVAELKKHIANWPETNATGEPTEVWIETGRNLSSPCTSVNVLNRRIRDDGTDTSDLIFESEKPDRFTLDSESGYVFDRIEEKWLTTAEEVFYAFLPPPKFSDLSLPGRED